MNRHKEALDWLRAHRANAERDAKRAVNPEIRATLGREARSLAGSIRTLERDARKK